MWQWRVTLPIGDGHQKSPQNSPIGQENVKRCKKCDMYKIRKYNKGTVLVDVHPPSPEHIVFKSHNAVALDLQVLAEL